MTSRSGGFFYTSPTFPFPYLYDFSLQSVVYYFPDPNNAGRYNSTAACKRYFYVFSTGTVDPEVRAAACAARQGREHSPVLFVLDNYDSFTYNLVQYFGELGAEPVVRRNDEITVEGIAALNPDAHLHLAGSRHAGGTRASARRSSANWDPVSRCSECAWGTRPLARCSAARWCARDG